MTATGTGVQLTLDAPAKINLFLHVTGRRDDGFHLLDSVVAFTGCGDRLVAAPAEGLSLYIDGPFADALGDETNENLVLRAAAVLREATRSNAGAEIRLTKNLPVASGIGGGSADAAAALRLLVRLWKIPDGEAVARAVAPGLGADVPVCLAGIPSRFSGIGEIVSPVSALPSCGVVLVNAGDTVSTPAVFAERTGEFTGTTDWPSPGSAAELFDVMRRCRNDLDAAACRVSPVIREVLAVLRESAGCRVERLSGSGGTCFGLYDTAAAAAAAAAAISRERPRWWVVATSFRSTCAAIAAG